MSEEKQFCHINFIPEGADLSPGDAFYRLNKEEMVKLESSIILIPCQL